MPTRLRPLLLALAGYLAVAVAFSWPLPRHLTTALTGPPDSDAGVYVWNLWVFHRELVEQRTFPLLTTAILAFDDPVNLSQHNYTIFANVLALPIIPFIGVVGAFNAIYLLQHVLAAMAAFILARRVSGQAEAAWIGGLVFGFGPALVARGAVHVSLVAAAPLAAFAWCLIDVERGGRRWSAVALGLALAWAALSDPYYAIYGVLIGVFHLAVRLCVAEPRPPGLAGEPRRVEWLLNGLLAGVGALTIWIAVTGGAEFSWCGRAIGVKGLHNPVLLLTVGALARYWVGRRWRLRLVVRPEAGRVIRAIPGAAIACAVVLSPVLVALALRAASNRLVDPAVFWRSSPPGVDLAAWLLPNPNHPLWRGAPWVEWLAARPGGLAENVASLPWAAVAIGVVAAAFARWRPNGYWLRFTAAFGLLSLGPFVRVGGLDTHVPTAWALLRYVPVVEWARTPTRFTAVALLGVAVLVSLAVTAIGRRWPRYRWTVTLAAGSVIAAALLPAPRPVYDATRPAVYATVSVDPRPVRVLEIPFGVRDGTSSAGNASAGSQFVQIHHGKPLIGGYLSRVSPQRVARARRHPVLSVLLDLSEGTPVSETRLERARTAARAFFERTRTGYVVVDRNRMDGEVVGMVSQTLDLVEVMRDDRYTLYSPAGSRPGPAPESR